MQVTKKTATVDEQTEDNRKVPMYYLTVDFVYSNQEPNTDRIKGEKCLIKILVLT